MYGTLQPDERSPKQVNTPVSTSQVKPGCDSGQNSGVSVSSQVKGKMRERGDHGADNVKRERSLKVDDGDSVKCRPGTNFKSEIARITEKGALTELDAVEKLVQLMQSDRMERNRDLICRSRLTGVIAASDKADCLDQFVHLGGLPVFDEWLQDVHKGKSGDGSNLKDGDKSVEDFVLVLLRALDKLPVNLQALQTCNIGRSVNHLRSHKNLEIQRKARSLVDTWKRRVEVEMTSIDTKSDTNQAISVWPSKSRPPESSHGGSRTVSGSDVATKSSVTQNSASKATSSISSHGESNIKSATLSPRSLKSVSSPGSGRESQPRVSSVGGTSDLPLIREDRSSSSNQSNNCSSSLSGKEDGKSSPAVLMSVNKVAGNAVRTRKSNVFHGTSVTGNQKDTSSSKIYSAHKNAVVEKSQPCSNFERAPEGPVDEGCSHKLVVKTSNQVQSPAQGISGESVEDTTFMSSPASSPVILDKQEQFDHNPKNRTDLLQTIDSKDMLTGPRDDAGSPVGRTVEEQSLTSEDSRRSIESTPHNELKSSKLQSTSFNPMNALIESCAKYSEGNSSLSLEDDVGMNLLASVAAGEMSRFDLVSPTDSTEISTPAFQENCIGDEVKLSSPGNYTSKQVVLVSSLVSQDGLHLLKKLPVKFTDDKECDASSHTSECIASEEGNHMESSRMGPGKSASEFEIKKSKVKAGITSLKISISTEKVRDDKSDEEIHEDISSDVGVNGNLVVPEGNAGTGIDTGESVVEIAGSNQSNDVHSKKDIIEELNKGSSLQQKITEIVKSEITEMENNEKLLRAECDQSSVSECGDEAKFVKLEEKNKTDCRNKSQSLNVDKEDKTADIEIHKLAGFHSTSNDLKCDNVVTVENTMITEIMRSVEHEAPQKVEFRRSESTCFQPDKAESGDSTFAEASFSAKGQTDTAVKIKFDLNEGFSADDGRYVEPLDLISSGATVQMLNAVPFSASPATCGKSASITVAAAAKGAFVPPEDLVRSKGELGWKGSAATSAFRPAEPRKVLDSPFGSTNSPCSNASNGRNGRFPLDIDLNVPDERVLEEIASRDSSFTVDSADFVSKHNILNESQCSEFVPGSGGLDLDLNRADEANDNTHCSTSSYHNGEGSIARIRPLGGIHSDDNRRDFDLNDGPVADCAISEHFFTRKQVKGGIPSLLPSTGLRMNSPVVGNFSSWFPPGNTFPPVSVPGMLQDRGDQHFPNFSPGAQRAFGHIGVTPLTSDVYRGSVLSPSPTVPFSSSSFQFPVFPFGTTFPLPSVTFSVGTHSYADSSRLFAPPLNSQFLGPVGSVTPQLQRPYVVNFPDNSSTSLLENNRKWGRQSLDLNAGPGTMENEVREELFPLQSVSSSQAVGEEQAWMYSVPGGIKRKEPENGWDNENFKTKQFSWQ